MSDLPSKADPEVAARTFDLHLTRFFAEGRPAREAGWERITFDPLHAVIRIPAVRADGTLDSYQILAGADYYDLWPPSVAFVEPVEQAYREARDGTRWLPKQNNAPGFQFGLHATYSYPTGETRQLLCFSHSLDYYFSNHIPTESQRWVQGRHTVSATLTRIGDVLRAPNFRGRAVLTIPEAVWTTMLDVLAMTKPGVERVAYLDGVGAGDDAIVTTVVIPNADLHPGWYKVTPEAMSEAAQHAREHGLVRLAQIHTHPDRDCGHSRYDDDNAYSQRPGAISIVLSHHASRRPHLKDAGVHVKNEHGWTLMPAVDVDRYVRCLSSLVDLRRDTWSDSQTGTRAMPAGFWRRVLRRMGSSSEST